MVNIIAIEGMPGAGKTTVIKNIISNNLLRNCVALPEVYIRGLDDTSESKMYLNSEVNKSEQINYLKSQYNNILLDRTFLSTIAYRYARSKLNKHMDEYFKLLKYFTGIDNKNNFIRPTHLFYLDVDISESIKRRKRFSKVEEFNNWFNLSFLKYFSEFYNLNISKFDMPECVFLDTTNLTEKDVMWKVVSAFVK